jgi:hypothetical protein
MKDAQRLAHWGRIGAVVFGVLGLVTLMCGIWEFGLTMYSMGIMLVFASWLLERSLYLEGALLGAFMLGYVISWCAGFLGFRYILVYKGYDSILSMHTVVTSGLVLVAVAASVLGGWVVLVLSTRPVRVLEINFSRPKLLGLLGAFGLFFIVHQVLSFVLMGTSGRWDHGNVNTVGSDSYLLVGTNTMVFPFYVLLGLSLQRRLLTPWNGIVLAILVGIVGLLGLTGGRTVALEPIVVVLGGAFFSELSWRKILGLFVLAVPIVVGIVIFLGMARGTDAFVNGGSVKEKVAATSNVMKQGTDFGNEYDDPMYNLFSRLFEPAAQTVIDNVSQTGKRVYLLNGERLFFVLVPRFIDPQKKVLNDGNERLVTDYGFPESDFTASPITLIADAYERFGFGGVAAFHLMAGALLAYLGQWVCRPRSTLFVLILVVCFARSALLLYPESNLGFFNIVIYSFARDLILISGLYYIASMIARPFMGSEDEEIAIVNTDIEIGRGRSARQRLQR